MLAFVPREPRLDSKALRNESISVCKSSSDNDGGGVGGDITRDFCSSSEHRSYSWVCRRRTGVGGIDTGLTFIILKG